jgi:nitrogen fixation/metabolism regulation signal transduction histidine kinase
MPRAIRYGFVVALAIGAVLLFLLASASSNVETFERFYPVLLAFNVLVALALFIFVVVLVRRLTRDFRAGRFGARLMAKFALAFALLGVVPGLLIYVVSVQFLSRTVESWFDVRVDRALESGLALGRAALEAQLADVTAKARVIALELADTPPAMLIGELGRARQRAGIDEMLVLSSRGQLIAAASAAPTLAPELPSTTQIHQAQTQRAVSRAIHWRPSPARDCARA